MENKDIRWIQRFNNYKKALVQLKEAMTLMEKRELSKLENQGVIQSFEFTHELAWKTLKDFLENRGNTNIYGSKDATREAFQLGLLENGDAWMQMIVSRNLTSHVYDENTVNEIVLLIKDVYFYEFIKLEVKLNKFSENESEI
jgi:nucleotidyltransferase substrate binding protein (TIGR01987 family)